MALNAGENISMKHENIMLVIKSSYGDLIHWYDMNMNMNTDMKNLNILVEITLYRWTLVLNKVIDVLIFAAHEPWTMKHQYYNNLIYIYI